MSADQIELTDTIVSRYLKVYPDERGGLAALIEQVVNEDELNDPLTMPGHITGSALVLSPDRTEILLVNHKFLQKWLQPGGHWEGNDTDPLMAAQREAEEETAVLITDYLPLDDADPLVPIDIETHEIPERPEKEMPAHLHHDMRYVFVAGTREVDGAEAEVNDARWFGFDAPECEHILPVLQKMRDHGMIEAYRLALFGLLLYNTKHKRKKGVNR